MPAVAKKPEVAKKLPAVPESKIKKEKHRLGARALLTRRKFLKRAVIGKRRRENLLRAEKYAKEYIKAEHDLIDQKRAAKKEGSYFVPGEAKLAFVIRIRG